MKNKFMCSREKDELHSSHWIYFLFINALLSRENRAVFRNPQISTERWKASVCEIFT